MHIASVTAENYRAFQHLQLDHLGHLNVLIGRNNVGKSTVFGLLRDLIEDLSDQVPQRANDESHTWAYLQTHQRDDLPIKIRLCFELGEIERRSVFRDVTHIMTEQRVEALLASDFLKRFQLHFELGTKFVKRMTLKTAEVSGEDGEFFELAHLNSEETTIMVYEPFNNQGFSKVRGVWNQSPGITTNYGLPNDPTTAMRLGRHSTFGYITDLCITYLKGSFFFASIRSSQSLQPVLETSSLNRDGSNLTQVLSTLRNNDESTFRQVEAFVRAALPDVGTLESRLSAQNTYVAFHEHETNFRSRLHDMGGGVEQLLLVATALHSPQRGALFIEEPESHLHPGAQRYLLSQLLAASPQVFLTTHSPTFVNVRDPEARIFRVARTDGRSSVQRVTEAVHLAAALEDVGARNSDVLLNDAVLFVEGVSDADVLSAWADALGQPLGDANLKVLTLGGGEHAERLAPPRSEVLQGISERAPIPHLFVVDRDHRSDTDIARIQKSLGARIHLLERRELENYLLCPRAILTALHDLGPTPPSPERSLDVVDEPAVQALLEQLADGLYSTVLIKRVRTALGGVVGGLLSREATADLIGGAAEADLGQQVIQAVEAHLKPLINRRHLRSVVREQRRALDAEWRDRPARLRLAPGEELLAGVYAHFGARFRKSRDAPSIARQMQASEIDPELRRLLERVRRLPTDQGPERASPAIA